MNPVDLELARKLVCDEGKSVKAAAIDLNLYNVTVAIIEYQA